MGELKLGNTARAALLATLVGGTMGLGVGVALAAAPVPAVAPPSATDLPINEIRCTGEVCSVGACTTKRMFTYAAGAASGLRVVPNTVAGKLHGFKLFSIKPGTWSAQLGLLNGDLAIGINGKPLDSEDTAFSAFLDLRAARELTLAFERQGKPFSRRLVFDQRPLTESECPTEAAPALPAANPPPTASAPVDPSSDEQAALQSLAKGITWKATRCTVDKGVLDRIFSDQSLLLRSGRIVPTQKDGKPFGIKLMGIRGGSLLALLGLKNGDLLKSIDQYSLAAPEQALAAYAALRNLAEANLHLERQGAPLTLTYVFKR